MTVTTLFTEGPYPLTSCTLRNSPSERRHEGHAEVTACLRVAMDYSVARQGNNGTRQPFVEDSPPA